MEEIAEKQGRRDAKPVSIANGTKCAAHSFAVPARATLRPKVGGKKLHFSLGAAWVMEGGAALDNWPRLSCGRGFFPANPKPRPDGAKTGRAEPRGGQFATADRQSGEGRQGYAGLFTILDCAVGRCR